MRLIFLQRKSSRLAILAVLISSATIPVTGIAH